MDLKFVVFIVILNIDLNFFFCDKERQLKFYIYYCQNKPKSMSLVHEFKDTYFAVS